MAARKSASSSSAKRTTRATRTARTARAASGRTAAAGTTGRLYPRRRRSRPGMPTTVGTALGALVVTTLLDFSWTVRIALMLVVLVVGLLYVLWRHRSEIAAAAATLGADGDDAPPSPDATVTPPTG